MEKIRAITLGGQVCKVTYTDSMNVTDGVTCDTYTFPDDDSRDLAIVRVARGMRTPLQWVLNGTRTTEGYLAGSGSLWVARSSRRTQEYLFPGSRQREVVVHIGDLMQWRAVSDLTFYEICEPPYADGRFQNLPEANSPFPA